jgi:hypothetical protein
MNHGAAHPVTEQVLRLFSHAERHLVSRAGRVPPRVWAGQQGVARELLVRAAAAGLGRSPHMPVRSQKSRIGFIRALLDLRFFDNRSYKR